MSTVAEIQKAIGQLSPKERNELECWLHPDWDKPLPIDQTPPLIQEKLAEAERGRFYPGDRANIKKILASLE
ncbi:MAG: hypothetical protein ABJC04_13160 [Verrucomicrobiota bacterium]